MESSDVDALIAKAITGDRGATAHLLVIHGPRLGKRLDFKMRSNPFPELSADDVLQEVFFDVFKGITTFDPKRGTPFVAWLNSIADNRLARVMRDRGRKKRGGHVWRVEGPDSSVMRLIADVSDEDAATASKRYAAGEAKQAVELCVASLPENQREAIERYYLEGGDLGQIAEDMGMTKEALRGLLYRARKSMRGMMGSSSIWFDKK